MEYSNNPGAFQIFAPFLPSLLRGEGIAGVREVCAAKIWNAPNNPHRNRI